jgi:hypothetical protein
LDPVFGGGGGGDCGFGFAFVGGVVCVLRLGRDI